MNDSPLFFVQINIVVLFSLFFRPTKLITFRSVILNQIELDWNRIEQTELSNFFEAAMFGINMALEQMTFWQYSQKNSKKELNDRIILDLFMQKHVWHKLLWFLSTWTSSYLAARCLSYLATKFWVAVLRTHVIAHIQIRFCHSTSCMMMILLIWMFLVR